MSHNKQTGSGRGPSHPPTDPRRALCGCIFIFLLLAGVTTLTVWLVYRPQKPRYEVVGVAVFNLNNTSPPLLSVTLQFSIVTRNPNKRVSIFYDHLSAFVTYHNQMITQPVSLPPFFHEKYSTVELSPILGGSGAVVPVSPDVSYGLGMDVAYGVVGLSVVLLGKLRWKAGAITTARYGLYVKCDVMLRLTKGSAGEVPFVESPVCKVDV
ncbi:hypothetical protein NMG60_11022651 [Bertholletia excelsa]